MSAPKRHTVIAHKEALDLFAREFVRTLVPRRTRKRATVIALFGDLGSGKTSFAQGVARALGVRETVISPTFIILRAYRIWKRPFARLVHIDCYRLRDERDILGLGWDELVADPKNIILVEWAERIRRIVPEDAIKIYFEHRKTGGRRVRVVESERAGAWHKSSKA